MKSLTVPPMRVGTLLLSIVTLASCDNNGLPPIVEELARKQAAQQESLTKQSKELSEASRQLVESDAKARKELVDMQSNVQTQIEGQRQVVQQQRDSLEGERREIAHQRHRDPLIAAALVQAATLLVAALPLLVLVLLIRAARQEPSEVSVGELIIHDLTAEQPMLLSRPLLEPEPKLIATTESPILPDQTSGGPDEGSSAPGPSPNPS